MLKKLTGGILAAVLLASSSVTAMPAKDMSTATAADSKFNYADALDKSLYFYEVQQAGPLPDWNRVEWRTDSTMQDPVLGGWYDAGDHVKFNLPMAYSASMLAWGLYQYPDGVEKAGLKTTYENNLEFVLDYFVDCDKGTEVVYQVGIGKHDHTWWGPVELLEYGMEDNSHSIAEARAALKGSKGCCAVIGEMAAALASGAAALDGTISASKKADYLKHADSMYELAKSSPDDSVYNDSDAQGFYMSHHCYDQLFYAANWLYIATGDDKYLADAKSFIPKLDKMLGEGDVIAYGWGHCWDDNLQGAMLLYAINTNDADAIKHVKKHCDRWVNGDEAVKIPGGLRWLSNWGCLRYANAAAFIATVAGDTVLKSEAATYADFAETQVNYALGDNPDKRSYLVGFGDKYPQNPHHRTSHGSWKNSVYDPSYTRHILYGALVGGPNEDGSYKDSRDDFINNEVATDYNAGFTAMLCKMIDKYGGTKDPSFPQPEKHDGPEFYVEVLSKGSDASGQTVSFKMTNHSAWPARVQDNLSFRYYMDLSEVIAAGKKPEDLVIRCDRDQAGMYSGKGYKPAEISKPIQYSGNIYYIEVKFPDGRVVLPISEGQQQCEELIAFVMPDYGSGWDSSNDFSAKALGKTTTGADGSSKGVMSPYVPVYINGKLYYGEEPDGTKADGMGGTGSDTPKTTTTTKPVVTTTTTTTAPAPTTTTTTSTAPVVEPTTTSTTVTAPNKDVVYGDANCDGTVELADAILIMQTLANPNKYTITEQGKTNADVDTSTVGLTSNDALRIQEFLLHKISNLDPNKA